MVKASIPQALLNAWGVEVGDAVDFNLYTGHDTANNRSLPYAIFHPSVGKRPRYSHGRSKLSSQRQVTVPEELLVDSNPAEVIIGQSGRVAVLSAIGDMIRRAELLVQGVSGPVGPYAGQTSAIPLAAITQEIRAVPSGSTTGRVASALVPPIFEAIFPDVDSLRQRLAATEQDNV